MTTEIDYNRVEQRESEIEIFGDDGAELELAVKKNSKLQSTLDAVRGLE